MASVTVLISSFDGYSDCWGPFCHGFTKYWPDCPYPILLMTNTKDHPHDRIATIKVEGGRDWSVRMINALDRIETPYVMYFQEDYWLNERVDTAKVEHYFDLMEKYGLNYIRLLSKPLPDADFPHDSRLGILTQEASYRTSVQITLWRKEVLQELLRPQESVWDFEREGTLRSRKYGDTFLSIKRHGDDDYYYGIRYVCTAVNYGKWSRMARSYAEQEGLRVDFSNLPMETWWDEYKRYNPIGVFTRIWMHRFGMLFRNPRQAVARIRSRLTGS
jgi:hypothetical protein